MSDQTTDTVLVVDDEQALRAILQKMLEEEGCHVLTAANGLEGQEILRQHSDSVSVVVLDWLMPEMNGIDLLRWMKQQQHIEHIPVIMLTALNDPARVKEGIDAGAYYYLVKPFQRSLLNSILRAAVADYRITRHLVEKLRLYEKPFTLLEEGTFRFRTLAEAENIAVMIAASTPDPEHAMVIAELLMNAVEHGNLGITYEEKGRLLEANEWQNEVERRLALPENTEKFVLVRTRRENHSLRIEIEDQGPGFEFDRYITFDESRLFDNHGRGIAMAASSLDIQYHGNGNKLVVTIPLS